MDKPYIFEFILFPTSNFYRAISQSRFICLEAPEWLGLVGVIATGVLLICQHSIVKTDDLSCLNAAFFTTNAFVSVILFVTMASDAFLLSR